MYLTKLFVPLLLASLLLVNLPLAANSDSIFSKQKFTQHDAVLVVRDDGKIIYSWRPDEALVPASLAKLLTSYLAIEKWGLEHRFNTEFYQQGSQLWIKGYGDPYLVSEEIDQIVTQLTNIFDLNEIKSVHVDASYFNSVDVPGKSSVSDPYNAPLSGLAANFNTVYLQKKGNEIVSAEPQTPLTATALRLAKINQAELASNKKVRVNLIDVNNAQINFAELLALKLGLNKPSININQQLPEQATLGYRHQNSHTLETVLVGAMKYSNNFIANQVFLKLAESSSNAVIDFSLAQAYAEQALRNQFSWQSATLVEGAGLSRQNKLTAKQLDDVLDRLKPHQTILKQVNLQLSEKIKASAYAKTGTLNGVRNYAGYINLPEQEYRFVFMFNRATTYGYRESLLQLLAQQLLALEKAE